MLSKIGEKEEKSETEHREAESGVVVLQQTNQLLVSWCSLMTRLELINRVS